jgi:23S rRNA (guanosine2251-2'-O)-methyltransferase
MSAGEWIHGLHAVEAMVTRSPARIEEVLLAPGRRDQRLQRLRESIVAAGIPVRDARKDDFDRHAGDAVHQGVLARVKPTVALGEDWLFDTLLPGLSGAALLLVLDGVTDPHNLGACLRNADAFGAHAVIVPKDHSAPLNATARKAASGAADVVPLVCVTNLARALRTLQEAGVWVVGAAGESAAELRTVDLCGPIALVLGAEGSGMRRLTREHCDYLAAIPMVGTVSSLNVSVAAGVFLYEAARQRKALRP